MKSSLNRPFSVVIDFYISENHFRQLPLDIKSNVSYRGISVGCNVLPLTLSLKVTLIGRCITTIVSFKTIATINISCPCRLASSTLFVQFQNGASGSLMMFEITFHASFNAESDNCLW